MDSADMDTEDTLGRVGATLPEVFRPFSRSFDQANFTCKERP
jgi:hypothetical protein